MAAPFRPSKNYLLMSPEFLREINDDLLRIQTATTVEEARAHADYLGKKIQAKFAPPKYDINKVLTAHVGSAKNSGVELAELDDTGKEKL